MTDQDDDSRIGAYAPPSDGYETFDAREEDGRRGTFLLLVAVAVIALFVAVVWVAFNRGVREADQAPRIVADVEPYRTRPADPGGEQTPDTGLAVYDRLTGENDDNEDVSLRPTPEEPMEEARPSLRVETVGADQTSAPAEQAEEATVESETPDITPRPAPTRPQPEPETPSARQTPAETPDFETPPASQPAQSEPSTPTQPAVQPVASGNWVVQIASFRTEADAEAAWLAFRTRFSDIASGLAPDVASVEIPNRGTYHRLRIAAFGTRDDAIAFCSTLQGRGQDCLVARR